MKGLTVGIFGYISLFSKFYSLSIGYFHRLFSVLIPSGKGESVFKRTNYKIN